MKISMVVLLAVALSGCAADKKPAKREMTQRQKDSAIGESRLPGAQGVRGALKVQDAQQARNNRLDSVAQQ